MVLLARVMVTKHCKVGYGFTTLIPKVHDVYIRETGVSKTAGCIINLTYTIDEGTTITFVDAITLVSDVIKG